MWKEEGRRALKSLSFKIEVKPAIRRSHRLKALMGPVVVGEGHIHEEILNRI